MTLMSLTKRDIPHPEYCGIPLFGIKRHTIIIACRTSMKTDRTYDDAMQRLLYLLSNIFKQFIRKMLIHHRLLCLTCVPVL